MSSARVKLFDINIDNLTTSETTILVEKKIKEKKPIHLLGVNADKINQLELGKDFEKIIKEAQIINADGASLVLASKFLKKPLIERVTGIDLMQELLKVSDEKGYSVYFLGAKEDVLNKMIENFKTTYPKLNIVGFRNGYFSKEEWSSIAEELTLLMPDIVFLGITSPKKEYLIDYFMNRKINSIFMGVGGSFDVLSGNIKRAPKWVQKINMEWMFRLLQEPRRLFKRYFIGNTKFLFKVLAEKRRSQF